MKVNIPEIYYPNSERKIINPTVWSRKERGKRRPQLYVLVDDIVYRVYKVGDIYIIGDFVNYRYNLNKGGKK